MKMENYQKYDDVRKCTKEGVCQVVKLIENLADDCSIAGVIDENGMIRRHEYGEREKWMH